MSAGSFFGDPWGDDDPSQPQSFFGGPLRDAMRQQSAGWGNPLLPLAGQQSYPGSLAPPGATFPNGAVIAPLAYTVGQTSDGVPRNAVARSPEQLAAIGDTPPAPPGYDPDTWKAQQWDNGRKVLVHPEGRTYTMHPEDRTHWRHWDINGPGGDDQGRWPPNSGKPRPTQKRAPYGGQSATDPSGDAPQWNPPGQPFVPVYPQPTPLPGPAPVPLRVPIPGIL